MSISDMNWLKIAVDLQAKHWRAAGACVGPLSREFAIFVRWFLAHRDSACLQRGTNLEFMK
jgi:hypothetical protein